MKTGTTFFVIAAVIASLLTACEDVLRDAKEDLGEDSYVSLPQVADMLSNVPFGIAQVEEVFDAVSSSSVNGFDEEYMMRDLFTAPGAGVGDGGTPTRASGYDRPLRDLIRESLASVPTKSFTADDYLAALENSDVQIYWPYSEDWDGWTLPVITYAPADGSAETNVGYMLVDRNGIREVEQVIVDEQMARTRPVWVINRNDDSEYRTLEQLRREDPEWGTGGGEVIVGLKPDSGSYTKSGESSVKSLILKDFTMRRNYDCWFAGASEFFVKTGSVEGFKATSEDDMRNYSPSVTDFMIVVKRKYKDVPVPFNAVLVSEWTDQLTQCAFLITEDDGGTMDSWKCSATVKYASKSYGFEMSIPFNSHDDIVWRGQLSNRYLEATSNMVGHFGDVDLTFEVVEY